MGKRARIGLIAGAMAVAIAGRGCVTAPPPVAESVVAGASRPVAESGAAGSSTPVAESGAAGSLTPGARSSSALGAGGAAAPDVPAPLSPNPPASAQDSAATAQTPDERRAALDKQLDDSLGAFDAKLHKEQQKTAEERDARQATVSTAANSAAAADGTGSSAAV